MNLYSIKETTLIAIGDAIRAKNGSTDTYTSEEFAAAIESIVATGGGEGGSSGGPGVIEHVSIAGTMYSSLGYQYDLTPYMDRDFYFVNWIRTSSGVDPYFQHFIYHAADGTTESLGYGNNPLTTTKANAAKAKGSLANGILTLDYYSSSYAVQNTCHLFVCNVGAGGSGGITPEGELAITENGSYDVTEYASAAVNVPTGIFPEGTHHITENGSYNIAQYENVLVEVAASGGGTEIEPIVLSGDCSYSCGGALSSKMIEMYSDKISTSGITNSAHMFEKYQHNIIPFGINLSNSSDCSYLFSNSKITKAPVIRGSMGVHLYLFNSCYYLTDLSEVANYPTSETVRGTNVFQSCKSLREIPAEVTKKFAYTFSSKSYTGYTHTTRFVSDCTALERVDGVIPPVYTGTTPLTANMFNYMVDNCYRLTHFTFATNENGTPLIRDNYTAQTIDFSGYVGYVASSYDTGLQYVGITNSTKVTDLTSYEALKDNPDWWTVMPAFSRYNHDSAIETINSLPDVSSSGGTNTIKFKGTMGSGYGKAISSLTEEEIAVATAKGWTVSIV